MIGTNERGELDMERMYMYKFSFNSSQATEFMKKQECKEYYGKYEYISFKAFHNDFHRSRWTPGDWTDDTGTT